MISIYLKYELNLVCERHQKFNMITAVITDVILMMVGKLIDDYHSIKVITIFSFNNHCPLPVSL